MTRYTTTTDDDRREMLAAIGVGSLEELFGAVPSALRLERPLALPEGASEQDVFELMRAFAERNVSVEDEISFLGAGMYDHYVPAVVDMLLERSEFLTPYTPYQPEVSQGSLQAMFEYQTAISELTGLPVSNASVYEGPSAVAAAGYMALLQTGRRRFVVSRTLHPHALQTLRTLSHGYGTEVVEVGAPGGVTSAQEWAAALAEGDVAAAFLAQPGFLGAVEELDELVAHAKRAGALVVCSCDPIALGLLRTPGEAGVDIAVGEGQPLGNRLDFGGPSFGFFAATAALMRRMPGRIAGETRDVDGRRGFVLTLQTREQHIRREKATSNICTAQALNALAGVIYLSWLGRDGLVELGELLLARTAYARRRLCELEGVRDALDGRPVVREFALRLPVADGAAGVRRVVERCQREGVNPGCVLGELSDQEPDGLLVALTERRSRADIDRLVDVLGRALAAEAASAPMDVPAGPTRTFRSAATEASSLYATSSGEAR